MNKKIFFTSDWHLCHENVIKFSERPFTDIDHMHRVLINNYNSVVGTNDICYFLGDVGMGNGEVIKEVLQQLNGTKILIRGNHDKAKGDQFYYSCGFSVVMYSSSLKIANELVTLSHCPLRGILREDMSRMNGIKDGEHWHGEGRHGLLYSVDNNNQFHLHGHVHSPNKGQSKKILDKQYDVGVDANRYRPVSISQIESFIARYKNEMAYSD